MIKYILASASPRRKELFKEITTDFECIVPMVEEIVPENIPLYEGVKYLSKIKAQAVAKNYKGSIVVGSDTGVFIDNKMLGKPKNREDAFAMLRLLSGRKHIVITGCTICRDDKIESFSVISEVEFFSLTDKEINEYLNTGEPFDKAGAYGIQGIGKMLVKEIKGDFYSIMGLPVAMLSRKMKDFEKSGV